MFFSLNEDLRFAHSKVLFQKMTGNLRQKFDEVFLQLEKSGLLLLTDSSFLNVRSIVTKRNAKGSWWSDDKAQTIFQLCEMLEDHPDVLIMKLIHGKVTFVHRELWGRIYSIGVARDHWQVNKLSEDAKLLLSRLDEAGTLETKKLTKLLGAKPGDAARELEARLLIHSQQIHTESGAHAKVLQTWQAWARRVGYRARAKNSAAARSFLDERVASVSSSGVLPWQEKK
jgi:hypothetical protein